MLALGVCACAQTQDPARNAAPLPPLIASPLPDPTVAIPTTMDPDLAVPAVPDTYQIGDGDLLSVFVYQMPDLTRQIRVSALGTIALPLLPAPLTATGLTAPELGAAVRRALLADRLARDPVVQVVVRQVNSRPIVVSGAVRYPGVIQATQPMTLLEVLSRAGGVDANAGTRVLLTESTPAGPQVRELSMEQILSADDHLSNPVLDGGESVRVMPARMAYAVGALQKPGGFPLLSNENLTVLKAVALAQGIKDPADTKHAAILRRDAAGMQEIPVNLDRILKHKAADLEMQPGDVLFVPESTRGKIMAGGAGVLAASAATAIGYLGYSLIR